MAAEELNKPAAVKPAPQENPASNAGNGDMASLIGNMGVLIDSTIESVQGMISSVSSATGQIIEGVTSTINSEPVKEIINNVNSVSGQLIEGVTATLKSEQVQSSVQEIGKLWKNLLENLNATVSSLNATVSSGQVQHLFDNVSAGLGQLVNTVFSPGMFPGAISDERHKKEIKQIPFSQKPAAPAETAPAPVKDMPKA
ncbi:MAG: chlorosome envelope protein H [Chlorobium sp.]|uniref:chlorosome envelope protein H n=1 Tax=Chlorobium sp. TaxID=1095 RepID=UPI0025C046CB|nr:chlorosome envelope protein H [Chlorobium sp.]MCF8382775.1 chlorosome envelope protein H [Chlorobium sp.]